MIFLHQGWVDYAWAMLLVLLIILGVILGVHPIKKAVVYRFVLVLAFFLFSIITPGIEWVVCSIFLLPLIHVPLFMGLIITPIVESYGEITQEVKAKVVGSLLIISTLGIPLENAILKNGTQLNL